MRATINRGAMKKMVFCALFFSLLSSCSDVSPVPDVALPSQAVEKLVEGVDNLYRVSDDLYRSGQPDSEGFEQLEELGIKSVLNLREYHCDESRVGKADIVTMRLPLAAGSLTQEEVAQALAMIQQAPKPVVIHCWHGSDRTGCIVAAYRVVAQGWTPEQAVAELLMPQYGHHSFWYQNIPELLRSMDWEQLRQQWKGGDRAPKL